MNERLEARRGLTPCTRGYGLDGVEVRAPSEGLTFADFHGHAAATGRAYEMYGGPEHGGWMETVEPLSFKRTLGRNPDVAFLANHQGLTMARTTAGNLHLAEDSTGLAVHAPQLDTRVSIVNDIVLLMEAKNLTEMSFAFRVTQQQWFNAEGDEVDWRDLSGIDRRIQAVDLHKGDVSIVNYGASPFTDASLRSLFPYVDAIEADELRRMVSLVAAAEKRAGLDITPATAAVLQAVLDGVTMADDCLDDALETLADLMGVPNPDDNVGGDMMDQKSAAELQNVQKHADDAFSAVHPDLVARQRDAYARSVALRAELL